MSMKWFIWIVGSTWIVVLGVVLALMLAGCATPISGNIVRDVSAVAILPIVAEGLKEAAANFDGAVAVGALPADDPAPGCVHGILADLGLEGPVAPFFTPHVTTPLGAASVLYIRAHQMQSGPPSVPASCKELIGGLMNDLAKAAAEGRRLVR